MARLWASGAAIVTALFGGCVVSFEDYPVAESDGGAAAGGLGGAAGAAATGGGGAAGSAGSAGGAGGSAGVCGPGDVRWAQRYGDAPNDAFKGLAWTADGLFVAGSHDAQSTLGNRVLGHSGAHDVFVGKLEPLGGSIWARAFGSDSGGAEYAVDATAAVGGSLVVTGSYSSPSLDFGVGVLPAVDDEEVFVARFSGETGETIWSRGIASDLRQTPIAVAAYPNGDVLVGLESDAPITLDSNTTNAQMDDIVLFKLSRDDGQRLLGQPFGDEAIQRLGDVTTSAGDTAYFGGSYVGSPPGFSLPTATTLDGFVATLDPGFSPGWAVRFGGNGNQSVHALAAGDSQLWVGGEFASALEVDGGAGLTTAQPVEGFVARMPLGGGVPNLYGLGGHSVVRDVIALADGGAVIAGEFQGTLAVGGQALSSPGKWSWFVARLDSSGKPSWSASVGNTSDNQFPVLAAGQGPSIVVGGTFQGVTDFEPAATPTTGFDPLAVAFCP